MPKMLRMPPQTQLPDGPHRTFVEELFMHYREAGRPSLRVIAQWIKDNATASELGGTASTETIRRVLSGSVVPRNWLTVEAILEALCGLAGRSTDEDRWPHARWPDESPDRTIKDELKHRWNSAHDDYETDLPELPPRPVPPPVPAPRPTIRANPDPWSPEPSVGFGSGQEEPPF